MSHLLTMNLTNLPAPTSNISSTGNRSSFSLCLWPRPTAHEDPFLSQVRTHPFTTKVNRNCIHQLAVNATCRWYCPLTLFDAVMLKLLTSRDITIRTSEKRSYVIVKELSPTWKGSLRIFQSDVLSVLCRIDEYLMPSTGSTDEEITSAIAIPSPYKYTIDFTESSRAVPNRPLRERDLSANHSPRFRELRSSRVTPSPTPFDDHGLTVAG